MPASNIKFAYGRITARTGHHTDASRGAVSNYLAKMISGTGRFVGEGYDLTFNPGDMYFIPSGFRYHSYWTGEPVIWDSIAFDWIPEKNNYPPQLLHPDAAQELIYSELIGSWHQSSAVVGKFYSLFGALLEKMKPLEKPKPSELFEKACRLLKDSAEMSVGEVARRCGISESGLYAEFRKFGTTPVRYRLKFQIDNASRLLVTTDLTVEEISEKCGFSSAAYFYRVFRKFTGKTTRELRFERMM